MKVLLVVVGVLVLLASAEAQNAVCTWNDNSDNESTFVIERATCATCSFSWAGAVDANQTTFTATGLPVGSTQCFRVYASNTVGNSDYSNVACTTIKALPSPTDVVTLNCSQSNTDPALALWYKFDNNANDSSGNNRTGVAAGAATYAAGKVGQALSLTGADGRVRSPLTTSPKVRTYTMWTYRKGAGGGGLGRIFDKRQTGDEVETLYNDDSNGVYRFLVYWSGGPGSWTFPQPKLNEWHHIAVVYDGASADNDATVYVDGNPVVVTQTKMPSGQLSQNADPYIVGNRGAGDRGWNGAIDHFQIYTRALSQQEVQAAMAGN